MQGRILDYSVQSGEGVISGDDGNRYTFASNEWRGDRPPNRGMRVDFEMEGANAVGVYQALGGGGGDLSTLFSPDSEKSRTVAGVLGIVLGAFGVHKFYLGNKKPAFIHLAVGGGGLAWLIFFSIIGAFVPFIGILGFLGWLAAAASGIIGFIEGILYLTKSDEEFEARYVAQTRPWF